MQELGWQQTQIDDLRYLGYSYIQQGIYPTALIFFEALSVLDPDSVYDLQTLGALYLQMGNGKSALDFLDRVLKLEPASLEVQLNRAKALFMLGYKRQGMVQAMELQNCSDTDIAAQARALLLAYR